MGRGWAAVAVFLTIGNGLALVAFAQAPQGAAPGIQLAQQQRRPGGPRIRAVNTAQSDDEVSLDGVFLPPDRTAKRRLETAQQLLDDRRFGESVRLLGSLLENSEDFFFKPNPEQPVYRSLKAEAGRLLAAMPGEGRESYELQFGARARQMLKQATTAGDPTELAEVSRRFFFTEAGQDATFLLGRHHLDQNRPLAAALCFERLRAAPGAGQRLEPALSLTLATCWLRSGKPEKAKETLVRFKHAHPADVVVAGKAVPLFANDSQALVWLQEKLGAQQIAHQAEAGQWTMFRGDASRNASSLGGRPLLNVRWRQRTADDSTVEKFIGKLRHDFLSQDIIALPALHPLAIGDVVVMRTAFALEAVDFQNGKLIWKYSDTDDSLEQFLKAGSPQQTVPGAQQLFAGLDQRMWEDAIYGTLSSDGGQIYYVEDLGLAGVSSHIRTTVMPNGHRHASVNSRGTNRLAARELRTQGKLRWEVGGITGEDEPKLAGAFFLGPPLPLLGRLYALAEIKGQEIRVMALSAKTGALEWSQQLASVDQGVTADGFRRNAGAVPSFADGLLVCPTSAGAIVAIDSTTRSLVWGYQYPRAQQYPIDRVNVGRPIYPGTERRASEHWADGSVTIADGRVLVTPVETDQLYCLNLSDGQEMWKQNRGDQLYVACVHRGDVVLVGRNAVSGVRLASGEKAWPDIELAGGSMPSGRGFYSGDFYYLPLTTAEVAKINLKTGRIDERSRSRSGAIPGNLVSHRGSIVSQGPDFVEAYYQIDSLKEQIAKTLRDRPDDPKALAGLAEVKLDQGLLAEAVALFRRSYELKPEEATSGQLIDSLLEALRVDFVANRGSLDELDHLVEQPHHRLLFWRLKALGLQAAGEILPAFETYMKLVDEDTPSALDAVDERLTVRRDRWIRGQLEQLYSAANEDQQHAIDAVVATRLAKALEPQSTDALRAFMGVFGSHPAADAARAALVARLGDEDLLERNLLLRKLERSGDDVQAATATAQMAQILRQAGRPELAAIYYRQLAGRFADVACAGGKTGKQLVADVSDDEALRKGLAADRPWPLGNVTVREDKAPSRMAGTSLRLPRPLDLAITGPTGLLFKDTTISFDMQQQFLAAEDGLGERRFRIQLNEQGARRVVVNRSLYNTPQPNYVSVNGGLLVLSLGNQLMALDTLRLGDPSSNRVLWMQELNDQIGGIGTGQAINVRAVALPWGGTRGVPEDAFNRRLGSIGPVNDDGVYFQRLHDLYCVNPLTGKTVWTRKNVGLGNDLFGDDELLFVAPPVDGDTQVLRTSTGASLGVRRVAPFNKRITTIGRHVLSWEPDGIKQMLVMRDAWLDQTEWSYSFAPHSKADVVSQEAIGILQPDGEFTLVSLADGKLLIKDRLEPEKSLTDINLLRTRDAYLLTTNSAARTEANVTMQPVPNASTSRLINGRLYAFDAATGKKLWPAPAVLAQQGLLLSQPSELPVLVFVRQILRPGAVSAQPKLSVLCIDKRSGRVLYQNDQLTGAQVANFEIIGDAAAKTVVLTVASKMITLTFTDDPLPQASLQFQGNNVLK
jgi:outer membrane protein assembly factor BamB